MDISIDVFVSIYSILLAPIVSYSSVRGVIFFSSISSSANSFLYFSHSDPVADGFTRQPLAEAGDVRVISTDHLESIWWSSRTSVVRLGVIKNEEGKCITGLKESYTPLKQVERVGGSSR